MLVLPLALAAVAASTTPARIFWVSEPLLPGETALVGFAQASRSQPSVHGRCLLRSWLARRRMAIV